MILVCKNCHKAIKVKQGYPYHAGFGDEGFLYCDKDSTILLFSSYDKYYSKIVNDKHPWVLNKADKERVERELIKCPCGGKFLFKNKPRCPFCNESIQNLLPAKIYYVILGKVIDGDKEKIWRNKLKPGIATNKK